VSLLQTGLRLAAATWRPDRNARMAGCIDLCGAAPDRLWLHRHLRCRPPAKPFPQVLEPSAAAATRDMTLATYLDKHGYSDAFRRHYLLPMCAAVWSVPNQQVRPWLVAAAATAVEAGGPGAAAACRGTRHGRSQIPQAFGPRPAAPVPAASCCCCCVVHCAIHQTPGPQLIPSVPCPAQVLEFPVHMLVRFWANHHLLDLTQRPKWRVVKDRSLNYVRAVLAGAPGLLAGRSGRKMGGTALWTLRGSQGLSRPQCLQRQAAPPSAARRRHHKRRGRRRTPRPLAPARPPARPPEIPEVLTATPVALVERLPGGGVRVTPAAAPGAREFDAVVLATHSDTALAILGAGATAAEREVLAAIPYNT
jgi:hypothetical protein